MAKSLVNALALASLPAALAFRNTSPFFLFSTADLLIPTSGTTAQSSAVEASVKHALSACPSKAYYIIRQDGVSSADFRDAHSTPQLRHYLSGQDARVRSSLVVDEVLGGHNASASLSHYIQTQCGARVLPPGSSKPAAADAGPWVIQVSFTPPAPQQRATDLLVNDAHLEDHVAEAAASGPYTVIYTTTPPTDAAAHPATQPQPSYEMDPPFPAAVQMELKRDLSAHHARARPRPAALFERYQFLSPALFMGFIGILPLFLIVFVGLKALASLEVSYFAFSKEMGPAAQRKQ